MVGQGLGPRGVGVLCVTGEEQGWLAKAARGRQQEGLEVSMWAHFGLEGWGPGCGRGREGGERSRRNMREPRSQKNRSF